ncbi:MAG: hypothetical protein AAF680_10320 [Pseudomonadota bacterium]
MESLTKAGVEYVSVHCHREGGAKHIIFEKPTLTAVEVPVYHRPAAAVNATSSAE